MINGGALLQCIPWGDGQMYAAILQSYIEYVTIRYGKAIVVFARYEDGSCTKDAAYQKCTLGGIGLTMIFTSDMVFTSNKDVFLSNKSNKQCFIDLLSDELQSIACTVEHAKADADVLIVLKAVESAKSSSTVVVGDDTDLLILLIYHSDMDSNDFFFISEPKKNAKCKIWNTKHVQDQLGPSVCKHILFVHVILGCDTT